MGKFIFIDLFLEETVHPRPSHKFHRHGVDFTGFIGWPDNFWTLNPTGTIDLESVTCFVGQNINITAGSVEVREDKWALEVRDIGTVATAFCLVLRPSPRVHAQS